MFDRKFLIRYNYDLGDFQNNRLGMGNVLNTLSKATAVMAVTISFGGDQIVHKREIAQRCCQGQRKHKLYLAVYTQDSISLLSWKMCVSSG